MGAVVSTQSTWDHIFDKNSSFIKNRRGVVNRTPYTCSDQRYMKLWVLIRFMSNNSNFNRIIFSYTLLWRRFISLLKGQAYLSRCNLRMNTTNYSRQRRQFFLRLFISPYWPGPILRVLRVYTYMVGRSYHFIYGYSYCFFRLCFTMRTNILLRCHSYY